MDEYNELNPSQPEGLPQDIYDVLLTFRKNHQGIRKTVTVDIRYAKIGRHKKRKLPFPEDIKNEDLLWITYEGNRISVHQRIRESQYKNTANYMKVTAELGHKLERLVLEAHRK